MSSFSLQTWVPVQCFSFNSKPHPKNRNRAILELGLFFPPFITTLQLLQTLTPHHGFNLKISYNSHSFMNTWPSKRGHKRPAHLCERWIQILIRKVLFQVKHCGFSYYPGIFLVLLRNVSWLENPLFWLLLEFPLEMFPFGKKRSKLHLSSV